MRLLASWVVLFVLAIPLQAAEFHIDPVRGDAGNDGSAARPWKNLQEVIDAGLIESQTWDALPYTPSRSLQPLHPGAPVRPGDTIWLHDGDHGDVMIRKHYNSRPITIAAAEGQTPRLHSLRVQAGSNWVFQGLHLSPEYGSGKPVRTLLDLESHGFNGPVEQITVAQCVLRSTDDASAWTAADWNAKAASGIEADGTRMTIRGNRLRNVDFGISVAASHSLVKDNLVENFSGDGLRGLGDHTIFEGNLVQNCHDVNDNHDDGFQSWSSGPDGPGSGQVVGIVLRGNTIINAVNPNQPLRGPLQGIGCFDGMYVDWVIENNVVVVDHYHGITLGGATNCRIVNNTVIDVWPGRPGPSAIRVGNHKKGMESSGCTVRNNLVSSLDVQGRDMTVDHNLVVEDVEKVFQNAAAFDLRLRAGSPAIDAGTAADAPPTDRDGVSRPHGRDVDLGAYESPAP